MKTLTEAVYLRDHLLSQLDQALMRSAQDINIYPGNQ
jgi:hypothetical protein